MTDTPQPPTGGGSYPGEQGYPQQESSPYPAQPGANPYAVQPGANPYAAQPGYPEAPAYGVQQGWGQAPVGTLPYVEQTFGPVAQFGPRVLASLIDGLIALVGLIPAGIGVALFAAGASDYGLGGGNKGLMVTGGVLIGLGMLAAVAVTIWNRFFRMGRTGQSVGKSYVGLRLIDQVTGQPIGAGRAFLREIVHNAANSIFYLSFLWMLWDSNRQTLGDMAMKSTVITVPKH